jgi:hypothetical protein
VRRHGLVFFKIVHVIACPGRAPCFLGIGRWRSAFGDGPLRRGWQSRPLLLLVVASFIAFAVLVRPFLGNACAFPAICRILPRDRANLAVVLLFLVGSFVFEPGALVRTLTVEALLGRSGRLLRLPCKA